jgi:hypothetical protein
MFKSVIGFVLLVIGALPVAAQSVSVVDFVPADFAGYVRLDEADPVVTVQNINRAIQVAGLFQPTRVQMLQNGYSHYNLIPFERLFDVEGTTFTDNIIPWLSGELVLAYRKFDGGLKADQSDFLIILATENPLMAANSLKRVVGGQDFRQQETYRDTAIYEGDKAALAFTTQAVFLGPLELVKAAMDVQAGEGARLTDQSAYRAVQAAMPEESFLSAYASGDHILSAVNGLINGEATSTALLQAFGGALSQLRSAPSFAQLLLTGGFDGVGASLAYDEERNQLSATVLLHHAQGTSTSKAQIDPLLLDMMPRNALLVHSGSDFSDFLTDAITAMPMSNFSGNLLGGFGLRFINPRNRVVTVPNAIDMTAAVNNFTSTLKAFNNLDLRADLLDHLGGNYALALLPRPNRPVPVLNTPFDLLVVTRSGDGEAALTGVSKLLETIYGLEALDIPQTSEWVFKALVNGRDAVFTLGYLEDTLIIATGDGEAARMALDAQRGDNRLTNQESWKAFGEQVTPDFYVDPLVLINTFFPSAGGIAANQANRIRALVHSQTMDDSLFQVNVNVTLGQ